MTWHEYFKAVTILTARKSTCLRLKVGAILVKENRIVSIGYNGVASKEKHCDEYFKAKWLEEKAIKFDKFENYIKSQEFYEEHGVFSRDNEIHAEQNCLGWAAKSGVITNGCELYVTDSPCTNCAKIILASGIISVHYNNVYDRDQNGIELLKHKIKCEAIDGFEINI